MIKTSSYLYRLSFFTFLLRSAHGAILRIIGKNICAFGAATMLCFVNIKNCFLRQFCLTNLAKLVFCSLCISAARADFEPFHVFGAKTEILQSIFS